MKVLVACEESQAVTKEMRKRGYEAYSCDLQDCSGSHPEWHVKQDVLPLLNGNCEFDTCDGTHHKIDGKWDLLVCHPVCQHLANSGARHFEKKRADGRQREGIEFFCKFLVADCDHIAIENPTQRIHPWMFGDNFSKTTCLWLKGLSSLKPEITEEPEMEWVEWVDKKTGKKKRQNKWYFDAFKNAKTPEERSRLRSKTFPGVARAFAKQWGKYLESLK